MATTAITLPPEVDCAEVMDARRARRATTGAIAQARRRAIMETMIEKPFITDKACPH
jgi:hypothetical protein